MWSGVSIELCTHPCLKQAAWGNIKGAVWIDWLRQNIILIILVSLVYNHLSQTAVFSLPYNEIFISAEGAGPLQALRKCTRLWSCSERQHSGQMVQLQHHTMHRRPKWLFPISLKCGIRGSKMVDQLFWASQPLLNDSLDCHNMIHSAQ